VNSQVVPAQPTNTRSLFHLDSARLKSEWFGNVRGDLLAGVVVALALIPEAIAFSIIAGVDPKVGLYASFCISVLTAIFGGRPGMISAATAATALLMVSLVREHGLQYLLAASTLAGTLQVLAGVLKVGTVMRFVSRSVMTGFVNALAILIFLAQLGEFRGAGLTVYAMVAAGLAIIYVVPRSTRAVPSPLVAIAGLTAASWLLKLEVRTVGDLGELPATFPAFLWPQVPFTLSTLWTVLPTSVAIAAVGLLESLMTAQIVDDLTDTPSDKNRECSGQGFANIASGFFGGMAGCAMIGQSVINIKSGGRGRLSSFAAGVFLLLLVVVGGPWVQQIPMPALVAVMFMVSISTFSWASLRNLRVHPKSTSLVMVSTVVIVVWTHNLALGVGVGVLLSALSFARKVAQVIEVSSDFDAETQTRRYIVRGQLFFASASAFLAGFDFKERPANVCIDVSRAHLWDLTSVGALDKAILKLRRGGAVVEVVGLNEASATIVDRLAFHDKPGALERLLEH
jgi:sulfate permease, SulP family